MSWFKIDDKAAFHRKVVKAGNEAFGAWTRAGSWSSDHETDGRIPAEVRETIAPARVWTRLLDVGLLEDPKDRTGDLLIHDFLDYNPSAEEVAAQREARAKAGAKGGRAKAQAKALALAKQPPTQPQSFANDTALAKPYPDPDPDPDPRSSPPETCVPLEPTSRARAAPAATPQPAGNLGIALQAAGIADQNTRAILDALRAHPSLAACANVDFAGAMAGRLMTSGKVLADVVQAIADAAVEATPGMTEETLRRKVRAFCDHARPPRAGPARAVPKQPPSSHRPKSIDDHDDPVPVAAPGEIPF